MSLLPRTCGAILSVALLATGGCRRPFDTRLNPVTVSDEGGTRLPEGLAGRWKADRNGWEFELDSEGRVVSAILSLGRVKVLPGQTTTASTRTGEQAIFTPGPWMVHYEPGTRMLTVRITMDRVQVPLGNELLEGSSTDVFCGVLSPAMDTWQTQWTTFVKYEAHLSDGTSADLSTDQTYGEAQPLVFTRTTE